jgi:hypothetical protein
VAGNARDGSALSATDTPAITASCPDAVPPFPRRGGPTSRLEVFVSELFSCAHVHGQAACHDWCVMRSIAVVGVLLIVLGLVALAYQSITYTSRETVIDIGPVHATADRERTLLLPPVLGVAAVAGGVMLLIAGVRKHA